ncbi:MAG: hypothetical protein B0D96_01605 [Candidatus Sedimenticola endophacoides]|uniref:Uncharacterized protein n=1 Tax=Candidatus Sedimenticola endophacoides TaxID=2548426 RepID=A0A657Q2T5_9GAMM|nr:MAG: hypothetical protein B0D94_10485 [Candidatus Sedimenticola endophacoides]OQX37685.1 MAG: hypothetical protein B0D96_01605 [Candidatus Sedimenticola endophacoides]OQX39060.1 MAG: hypothetical protein B0D89_11500 [Candidatus Sedimenticola endophacoides]OQX42431.1 MAG: hypothetical protein B0D88_06640 [Candidatus Sedimenticola endophacoides]OQX43825.1 MAG: hypothetical protein B0D83_00750 [Candidatus Sedimenticola endophacoides]
MGEIVALKPPSSPKQLGVVRWLREDVDRLVNMGVELLRGRVVPGVLHQDRMAGEVSHHRGLVHTSDLGVQTLITAPFYFNPFDNFQLSAVEMEGPVSLLKQIEGSASFVQFGFSQMTTADTRHGPAGGDHDDPPARAERQGRSADDLDFEELWDTL